MLSIVVVELVGRDNYSPPKGAVGKLLKQEKKDTLIANLPYPFANPRMFLVHNLFHLSFLLDVFYIIKVHAPRFSLYPIYTTISVLLGCHVCFSKAHDYFGKEMHTYYDHASK